MFVPVFGPANISMIASVITDDPLLLFYSTVPRKYWMTVTFVDNSMLHVLFFSLSYVMPLLLLEHLC